MHFRSSQHSFEDLQQTTSPAASFHSAKDGQESDYGSDLDADDEQLLSELLARIATTNSPVSSPPPLPPSDGAGRVLNNYRDEPYHHDPRPTLGRDLDLIKTEDESQGQWIDIKIERDLDGASTGAFTYYQLSRLISTSTYERQGH